MGLLALAPLLVLGIRTAPSSPAQAVAADPSLHSTVSTTSTVTSSTATDQATERSRRREVLRSVKASVLRARAGTPLPAHSRPMLDAELSAETAGLGGCDYGSPHDNAGGRLCLRGDPTGDRTVVVFGDSHGRHWVPALQHIAQEAHYKAYYLVKQQCTASIVNNGDPAVAHPTARWAACHDFRNWALKTIADLRPDVVIVSTSVPTRGLFTTRGFVLDPRNMLGPYALGFRKLWHRLHAATDARLVLLRDIPARAPGTSPDSCFGQPRATQTTCLSPQHSAALEPRVRLVEAAVHTAERAGVQVIDPTPWFCWHGECPAVIGHYLPYRNAGHITTQWARHLTAPLSYALHL